MAVGRWAGSGGWVGRVGWVGCVGGWRARGAAASAGARAWDSLAWGVMMCGAKGATSKGRAVGVHGRAAAAAAAARSSLTVCVRAWWWCVCAVGFVVGGGAVFVLLLCGLCWRGGRAGGWWRWAGVGGGGHVTARVGWCVARGAAASWAVALFVGVGGWWPRSVHHRFRQAAAPSVGAGSGGLGVLTPALWFVMEINLGPGFGPARPQPTGAFFRRHVWLCAVGVRRRTLLLMLT